VAKTKEMKGSFNEQFASVHELCLMVLTASTRPDLIKATLMTLNSFLGWVPLGYILESNMVDILLGLVTKEGYRYVWEILALSLCTRSSSHGIRFMRK
jgi:exportin-1